MSEVAELVEKRWHARTHAPGEEKDDVHVQRQWWEEERKLWEHVGATCENPFHWKCRLDFLNEARRLLGLPPYDFSVSYPSVAVLHSREESAQRVEEEEATLVRLALA